MVRDIPYGDIGSRDPMKVLEKKMGTCSGKHLLLGGLYQAMGIRVKYMMCLTKFNFIENALPEHLREMLARHEIYDYHNYLRIFEDTWIDVDATFDMPLKKYGFSVNNNWDCSSDCDLAFEPLEIYQVDNLVKQKKEALCKLTSADRKLRKDFIRDLSRWMKTLRDK